MKNLKLVISMLTLLFVFSVNVNNTEASSGISIYVNGERQSYSNQAIIENGVTLVPLRGIFEALGASVKWNSNDQTISATRGNTNVWLKIGWGTASVNGQAINISVPAKIKNGSTLVPLRFISEALGENVQWDNNTRTITIGSPSYSQVPSEQNPSVSGALVFGFDDIYMGMTKQQVKDVENATLITDEYDTLSYVNKYVHDVPSTVVYQFSDNRLYAINVYYDYLSNQASMSDLEDYFFTMYDTYSAIFGYPVSEDTNWFDDADGYSLSALWLMNDYSALLVSMINDDYSSNGGIRIEFR